MNKPFFSSVLGYSSAVLTIAGLAFYCVSRIAYSVYYGHYDASPESVGITFQGLLTQEASAVNLGLLIIVTVLFLRSGWLVNFADLDELKAQQKMNAVTSDRELMIRSIDSGAIPDRNVALRDLEKMKGTLADLEGARSRAAENTRLMRRRGLQWLAAGLLIFGLWGAGMITEAAVAPTSPRASQWFDPLQIDVLSVTSLRLSETQYDTSLIKGIQLKSPLFLGTDDMNYVLYDRNDSSIWLIPERFATLTLR